MGATQGEILAQFLAEAVMISVAGGVAGIILGVVFASAIERLANISTIVSPLSVILAFGVSVAVGLVRQAMELAEKECIEAGLGEHWRVFVRHHVDGRSYEELQSEFGLDEKRFKVMSRTAGNKFKASLRDLIRWRGASEEDVDIEIRNLMEIIES